MKKATLAAILILSSLAVYDVARPVTVGDAVKEIEPSEDCGNRVEEEYLTFCKGNEAYSVTAKEVCELGSTKEVEQKLHDIFSHNWEILFDFKDCKFIKDKGGYIRTQ